MNKILLVLLVVAVLIIVIASIRPKLETESAAAQPSGEGAVRIANSSVQTDSDLNKRVGPDEIYPRPDLNPGWPNGLREYE